MTEASTENSGANREPNKSCSSPGIWSTKSARCGEKMAANPDFKELFAALCDQQADFLVVGAHAVMIFTEPRFTKDLDIWVRPTADNASRVFRALQVFGAPLSDLTEADLATPGVIFQIGVAPNRIDILTKIDGVDFDGAWARRVKSSYDGQPIAILSLEDLIRNKRACGRKQDLIDLEKLEAAEQERR